MRNAEDGVLLFLRNSTVLLKTSSTTSKSLHGTRTARRTQRDANHAMRHEYPPDSTRAPQRGGGTGGGGAGRRCWASRGEDLARPMKKKEKGEGRLPPSLENLPTRSTDGSPPHLHLQLQAPTPSLLGCKLPPHAHEHSPFSTFVTFSSSNVRALSRRPLAAIMVEDWTDWYAVLHVDPTSATSSNNFHAELRAAFRRCLLKTHPDKNNGDATGFQEVVMAYSVLSDDLRRRQYDCERFMRRKSSSSNPTTPVTPKPPAPTRSSTNTMLNDASAIFASLFGERSPFKAFTPSELGTLRDYTDRFFTSPGTPPTTQTDELVRRAERKLTAFMVDDHVADDDEV